MDMKRDHLQQLVDFFLNHWQLLRIDEDVRIVENFDYESHLLVQKHQNLLDGRIALFDG